MSARITRLTAAQEDLLPVVRDEWIAHELSTEPADRAAAEAGVRMAYQAAGLQAPKVIAWLGSPMAGVIGRALLATARPGQTGSQAYDKVLSQVSSQMGSQALDQVTDQVTDQVWGQLRGQVWDQVRRQVSSQVMDQVMDQAWGQGMDQAWGQVMDQVTDQVRGQLMGQVMDQVTDQAWGQLMDQVRGQGSGLVWGLGSGLVWGLVSGQVSGPVRSLHGKYRDGLIPREYAARHCAWADVMQRVGVTGLEPFAGCMMVTRSAGWWWAYRHWAIITDRPESLHRDAEGRLHSGDGMAIGYRDGWGLWAWHGRRVPQWVISSPGIDAIAAEPNVEVRRCAIESLGWDRLIDQARLTHVGQRAPDPGNPGQYLALYDVPERLWGSRIRLLLATNGTTERDGTRRRYGLTVPAGISDPVQAAAWTYRMTADEYARCQRRT